MIVWGGSGLKLVSIPAHLIYKFSLIDDCIRFSEGIDAPSKWPGDCYRTIEKCSTNKVLSFSVDRNKSRAQRKKIQIVLHPSKMCLRHSKSALISLLVMFYFGSLTAKRLRLPIPKSLVVLDSSGIDVISDAVFLTERSGIFSKDHHFVKRIAIVEAAMNKTSKEGGLWRIDRCAFTGITQNRRKYRRLVSLQKRVRKTYGITWSRIRHFDLRRPIYSVLAVRLYLEITMPTIPRRLRSQALLFSQEYHKCADLSSGEIDLSTRAWRERRFIRGNLIF